MTTSRRVAVMALLAACSGCTRGAPPSPTAEAVSEIAFVPLPKAPLGAQVDWQTLKEVTPDKVMLGRLLFFDPRLSADQTISCASCHRSANAFADRTPNSVGVHGRRGSRKTPTFVNGAWQHRFERVFGWDGRAASLAAQSKAPIFNPEEMDNTSADVVAAIAQVEEYRERFQKVYPDKPIDIDDVADAIGAYMASRVSGNSAVDRFETGDKSALSDEAARGRELFLGRANCIRCHFSWTYTDSQFHNLGIGWNGAAFADPGRAAVTANVKDTGAFKTPALRDVAKRAPYMHDGSMATLREVIDHYDAGGAVNPWISDRLEPLGLSEAEKSSLVAFLNALDGEGYADPGPIKLPGSR
jgi:cytochrome c peroxidase